MLKKENISEFPTELARIFVSDLQIRPTDGSILLYIPKDKIADIGGNGFISLRQIKNTSAKLEAKYHVPVNVVYLKSRKVESLESGLLQMLNLRFGGAVEQLYMSVSDSSEVNSWISVSNLTDSLAREIYQVYEILLSESSMELIDVHWNNSDLNLPSLPYILKITKNLQPATLQSLNSELMVDYPNVSEVWLNKQYDKLIKKGFVVREHSFKSYSLTAEGLSLIPNSSNRNGSDVTRALALGRRKW
ncbi:hypothetical protein [Shewanella holmiensis]|uniref:Uncharacterized protein n=1 Tax=Shewanella holmiensis TaxID=2952222 RepID=A0A9X2WR97_9GAMM|nr:hypothetical protein [Shewanella holmiensis]MCT7943632.1 hypothetical protein [Shewanella holmiensis]